MTDLAGRTIDGYRIDELLGRGGMGVVYRATQLSLSRPVAIKVLPEADERVRARFEREIDILSRLSHPRVVTVFTRGEIDGRPYLVMEYVPGASLRRILGAGPLPALEAVQIARGVLAALAHAHARGVLHRDVKPENVLVGRGGVVKVVDFGLGRLVERGEAGRLTRAHTALGTREYMAPEQRGGARDADARTDLYAVGVVLYEMVAGELPLGNFASLADRRIDAVVERALRSAPGRRYADSGEMDAALAEVQVRLERKARGRGRGPWIGNRAECVEKRLDANPPAVGQWTGVGRCR